MCDNLQVIKQTNGTNKQIIHCHGMSICHHFNTIDYVLERWHQCVNQSILHTTQVVACVCIPVHLTPCFVKREMGRILSSLSFFFVAACWTLEDEMLQRNRNLRFEVRLCRLCYMKCVKTLSIIRSPYFINIPEICVNVIL